MKAVSRAKQPEESTVDGILTDEELLEPVADDDSQMSQKSPPTPESVMDLRRKKHQESVEAVRKQLEAEDTKNVKFRNNLLNLLNCYFVKSKYLQLSHILQLRAEQAEAIQPLMPDICQLALNAFNKQVNNRFLEVNGELQQVSVKLLSYTLTICQNYSDVSDSFSRCLASIPQLLQLCKGMLCELREDYLEGSLHKEIGKRLRQCLSIIYNIFFKKDPDTFFILEEYNFVEVARLYLGAKDEHFRFSAYLVMVFGSNEQQASEMLMEEKGMARFLVKNLRNADRSSDRRAKGYHVVELATCAHQCASNESNKQLLIESGILEAIASLLMSEHEDSTEPAIRILWSLSFSDECAKAIGQQIAAELRTVTKRANSANSVAMQGLWMNLISADALPKDAIDEREISDLLDLSGDTPDDDAFGEGWGDHQSQPLITENSTPVPPAPRLRGAAAPPPPPAAPSANAPGAAGPPPPPPAAPSRKLPQTQQQQQQQQHVMISYNQRSSTQDAKWIRDELAKRNIAVWIDLEQMQESTLDCMAKAVEGAFVVLMFVTKGYKESDFCRMEAEYAVRRKKQMIPLLLEEKYKPDGWLGFILGSQRYYDFSGRKDKQQMLEELMSVLLRKLPSSAIESVEAGQTGAAPPPVKQQQQQRSSDWSVDQVNKWITDNQLPIHLHELQLNGKHLNYLLELKRQAPEAFYRILHKSLHISLFHHLFDFVQALDRLS